MIFNILLSERCNCKEKSLASKSQHSNGTVIEPRREKIVTIKWRMIFNVLERMLTDEKWKWNLTVKLFLVLFYRILGNGLRF